MSDQDYKETLSLDVSNFLGGLQAAQVALGTFAATLAERALDAVKDFATEIVGMAREVGKSVEALENLSAATAVSQKNLTTLESLAKVSGASMEGLASVMRILSRNMAEADAGNMEMQAKLKLLGITSRDAWTALMQVSNTLSTFAADTNRVAISTQVLGRGFAQILPAIKDGASAFKEAEERSVYLGTAFDYFSDGKIKKMDDAFDKMGLAVEGFWRNLVGALAPAIQTVVEGITELIVSVSELMGALSFQDALTAQWIRFSTLLKEIGVNAVGIATGQVFSEAGRNAMRAEIDAIEAEAKARLMQLRLDSFTPKPEEKEKPSIGIPQDNKQAIQNAEQELKLEQETVSAIQKMTKARYDFEKAQIAEKLSYHTITDAQAANSTNVANQQETAFLMTSLSVQLSQLSVFHQRRLALGFGTQQELETYEKEYATQSLKIVADLEAARVKAYTEEVQGRQKMTEAQQRDDRKSLEDAVHLSEARVTVGETELRSYEDMAKLRANLLVNQKALAIQEAETAGRETLSIRQKYDALLAQEQERASNGFVRGTKEGFVKYINDTNSMFSLGVQMAQQTAQAMTQAFQSFFFDLFSGKINSLKDLMRSFLDFVKQIVSRIAAEIAATAILRFIGPIFGAAPTSGATAPVSGGSFSGETAVVNQGGLIQRFSLGGPVVSNGDSVPAMLTPGEFVVSRQGVDALNRINQGQVGGMGGEGSVTVNVVNSGKTDKPQVNMRRELKGMVLDIIFKDVASNGDMRKLLRG